LETRGFRILAPPIVEKEGNRQVTLTPSQRERLELIASHAGIPWGDITGPCRQRHIVDVRHGLMAYLRSQGWAYERIGELFGGRDHKTVMHACRKRGLPPLQLMI